MFRRDQHQRRLRSTDRLGRKKLIRKRFTASGPMSGVTKSVRNFGEPVLGPVRRRGRAKKSTSPAKCSVEVQDGARKVCAGGRMAGFPPATMKKLGHGSTLLV